MMLVKCQAFFGYGGGNFGAYVFTTKEDNYSVNSSYFSLNQGLSKMIIVVIGTREDDEVYEITFKREKTSNSLRTQIIKKIKTKYHLSVGNQIQRIFIIYLFIL